MQNIHDKEKRKWVLFVEKCFEIKDKLNKPHRVRRKTYLWLCLLSIVGVNQFYARRYVKGVLYLAIACTGISVALGFIDWMEALPKEVDADGYIIV